MMIHCAMKLSGGQAINYDYLLSTLYAGAHIVYRHGPLHFSRSLGVAMSTIT